jgi:hypothetical protein
MPEESASRWTCICSLNLKQQDSLTVNQSVYRTCHRKEIRARKEFRLLTRRGSRVLAESIGQMLESWKLKRDFLGEVVSGQLKTLKKGAL